MDGIIRPIRYEKVIDLPKIIEERGYSEYIEDKAFIGNQNNMDSFENNESVLPDNDIPIHFHDTGARIRPLKVDRNADKKEQGINVKLISLRILVYVIKKFALLAVNTYHALYDFTKKLEYNGVNNLDTKYIESHLWLLGISLPQGITDVSSVQLCYPLLSRSKCYTVLKYKKDKLKSFNEVFKKN